MVIVIKFDYEFLVIIILESSDPKESVKNVCTELITDSPTHL